MAKVKWRWLGDFAISMTISYSLWLCFCTNNMALAIFVLWHSFEARWAGNRESGLTPVSHLRQHAPTAYALAVLSSESGHFYCF